MNKKSMTPMKIYALLVSSVTMVSVLISLSISAYTIIKNIIITDEEYLLSRSGWYFDTYSCEMEMWLRNSNGTVVGSETSVAVEKPWATVVEPTITLTAEQIETCKATQRTKDLGWRTLEYKETLIGSATRFVVSLFVLIIHVPMMRKSKEDKTSKVEK